MTPSGDQLPLLEPGNRAELRDWLEANHATSSGVRVAIGKNGNTVTTLTYDDAVEEALSFGWIDSTSSSLDANRYAQLLTPRRRGSNWAPSNKARVARLIADGLMRPAGLTAIDAAKADGSWMSIDHSEDATLRKDLASAFAKNPDARRYWHALPPGQRTLTLRWIGSAKRPETRSKRIAEAVRAAAESRRLW